jgi:hypothetical protein
MAEKKLKFSAILNKRELKKSAAFLPAKKKKVFLLLVGHLYWFTYLVTWFTFTGLPVYQVYGLPGLTVVYLVLVY